MPQQTTETNEKNWEEIDSWFKKVGRIPGRLYVEEESELEEAKTQDGVKKFKRKLLGFCGKEGIKSLDQIAQALVKTGVSSTLMEAKDIAQKLVNTPIGLKYGEDDSRNYFLHISPVIDSKRNKLYEVIAYSSDKYHCSG